MHCGLAIVLPDGVGFDRVEAEVARIMSRWDENREVAPYLVAITDEPRVSGPTTLPGDLTCMRELYGSDDLNVLAGKMRDWNGRDGYVNGDTLYSISTENPEGRWDEYEIMELSDIPFPNGIGYVRDFPKNEFCRALILPDGKWLEREPRYRDRETGMLSYNISEWIPIFQTLISEFPDNIIVTLDTHY